jgi:hypothetical protein
VIIRDVSADPAPSRAEFTRFANFDGGLQDVDNTRFSLAVEPGSCVRLFDLKDYKGFATPLLCAGQRVARAWNLSTVGARASSMKVCHRRARRACQS